MLDMIIAVPPITRGGPTTTSDIVTAWVIIGVIVVLVLAAAISLVIAAKRSAERQSQMREAEQHYEALPQLLSEEQREVHAADEKVLLPR